MARAEHGSAVRAMKGTLMKRTIMILAALLASSEAFANPRDGYLALLEQGKFDELERYLASWTRSDEKNPEVYIAWFNYFVNRKMKTGLSIDSAIDARKSHMVVTDPVTGRTVGYLGDAVYYDHDDVQNALRYLDMGIMRSRNRLDMHFGKIRILGETGRYAEQAEAVIEALELSAANGNEWLWSLDEPVPGGRNFLLDNLQDFYDLWFRRSTVDSLKAVEAVAARQISIYPDHPFAYNALAYQYSISGRNQDAMGLLLEAYSHRRNDYVIIGNIATLYAEMGDEDNARLYLGMMQDSGDPEITSWAESFLERLR